MNHVFGLDWDGLFRLSLPLAEIIVRGSVFYWFLFFVFRFVVRRDVGAVGVADILILVIVADASQNAMAGEYKSIGDGMVLVSTLIGWNMLLDWLSFRFKAFRRFAEPAALCLVLDGRMLRRNMRKEFITEDELLTKLREQGIESLEQVKAVYLEPDGQFSAIQHEPKK
jgi:uncharacterized membrane protein YcaP (DUF421 family)